MSRPLDPKRTTLICLILLTVILGGAALHWLRPVMIPFVLALLFMYGLSPIVDFFVARGRIGRGLAVAVALGLSALVLLIVAQLIEHSVRDLRANASAYTEQINTLVRQARSLLDRFGLGNETLSEAMASLPVPKIIGQVANEMLGLVSNSFLVLVFMIYLLLARTQGAESAGGLRGEIERRIKRYIVVKVGLSALTGTSVAIILSVLGVDLAMVFGLLAFFLNFIPNIGSILATLLPLPIVLVDPQISSTTMILAIALPGAVQLIVGNVVEPKMIGDSLELHPITILLSLIIWGMLWGVAGMVLAAPLTAVIKILCEPFELTRPFAQLMAGKLPAPSPPEEAA
jgi:AI-2 transport protein TqsA